MIKRLVDREGRGGDLLRMGYFLGYGEDNSIRWRLNLSNKILGYEQGDSKSNFERRQC